MKVFQNYSFVFKQILIIQFYLKGIFSISNLLTICRITFYLRANQHLGPLQLMFISMIKDIFKFIIIFIIIFLAYLFSMSNLFWYYDSKVRNTVEIIPHLNLFEKSQLTSAEMSFGK